VFSFIFSLFDENIFVPFAQFSLTPNTWKSIKASNKIEFLVVILRRKTVNVESNVSSCFVAFEFEKVSNEEEEKKVCFRAGE
jgi:hypothetical protein